MLFGTVKNPKGPNLGKSKPVSYNLSGTRLNFVSPSSNASLPGRVPSASPPPLKVDLNIYSFEEFVKLSDRAWGYPLAKELYDYHGIPLWSPHIGGMDFSAELRRPSNHPNLLKATHYENWVDKDIKGYYAPKPGSVIDEWSYLFPLFWQTFKLPKTGNIQWVAYIVQDLCARNGDQFTYYVRSAISAEHELIFSFRAATDEYNSGAFTLFKRIVRFILNNIEITLVDSIEREIEELKKAKLRNFSTEKPICLYDDTLKNPLADYELLEDPCFYFTRIGKTIDRRLWVD
ncbi:hypothetical protein ACJJIF_03510 [Microbulbifer sp. SSSA002]|uniref:hypothetical protein n=1 Tax=unclassified Microbulbifer TaxID=2619833 RepID=UPI004039A032